QTQLSDLQTRIAARQKVNPDDPGPSKAEDTLMSSLNARMTQLTQDITTAEAKGPQVVAGGTPLTSTSSGRIRTVRLPPIPTRTGTASPRNHRLSALATASLTSAQTARSRLPT